MMRPAFDLVAHMKRHAREFGVAQIRVRGSDVKASACGRRVTFYVDGARTRAASVQSRYGA